MKLASIATVLVALLTTVAARADSEREPVQDCHALFADVDGECIAGTATVQASAPCASLLPRVAVRPRPGTDAERAAAPFEVVVENVSAGAIAFASFDDMTPMFEVQARRDDDWETMGGYCALIMFDLTTGHLAPGGRGVFPLDANRTSTRPFRVGLPFWFPGGGHFEVWSPPTP